MTRAGTFICDSRPSHACISPGSATVNRPSRRIGMPSLAHRCALAGASLEEFGNCSTSFQERSLAALLFCHLRSLAEGALQSGSEFMHCVHAALLDIFFSRITSQELGDRTLRHQDVIEEIPYLTSRKRWRGAGRPHASSCQSRTLHLVRRSVDRTHLMIRYHCSSKSGRRASSTTQNCRFRA